MKKLLIAFAVILLLSIGFYLVSVYTTQPTPDGANFYSGNLVSIDSELKFTLDCCDQVLQLGMVTLVDQSQENVSKIQSLMEQYKLQCTASSMGERQVNVDTVYCTTEDGLLSGLLIDNGLVEENCEQSANEFGTCA